MPPLKNSRISIAGVSIDTVSFSEAVRQVSDFLQEDTKQQFLLTTPNPEMVLTAQNNAKFQAILNNSTLAVPDGIGIIWASYFLSLPGRNFYTLAGSLLALLFRQPKVFSVLPERVTGTDLLPEILRLAARRGEKVFLLGARPGVTEKVKTKFEREIPGLKISGAFSGSPAPSKENSILQKIKASKATLLFVAFGAPAQEQWLAHNLPKLKQIKFAAGIGGAFDFHAKVITRAPKLFRGLNLEWLWRLIRQPSRLPRIWNATVRFIWLVWQERKF